MNNYFGVFVALLYMFVMFFCMGNIINTVFHLNTNIGGQLLFYGGAAYFLIFSAIYIPIQFTTKNFNALVIIWYIVSALIIAVYAAMCILYRKKMLRSFFRLDRRRCIFLGVLIVLAAVEIIYSMKITRYTSDLDSSTYNGIINIFASTGSLTIRDPYTGEIVDYWSNFKSIMPYEAYAATLSVMFKIHPLIVVNRVMGIFEITANLMIVVLIAKKFLGMAETLAAAALVFLLNISMSAGTIYTSSAFLFYRLAEPKSITANVILPLIWLDVIYLYDGTKRREAWGLLFLTVLAGLLINDSAIFLVPACLFILLVPLILYQRKAKTLIYSGLCFIPCIAWLIFYLTA